MGKLLGIPSLKFEPELEEEFRNHISSRDKRYIRVAFISFTILYAIFSWTDYILVPQWFPVFFAIRFYVVVPVLVFTIAFTFHSLYYKYKQPLMFINFLLGGAGIAIMLVMEPLNVIYYGGLFLVFTAGYFMLNLNFKYATLGGSIVLTVFIGGAIAADELSILVLSAFLFLVAENVIGAVGAYQIERFRRNEFLNIHNLSKEQIQLNEMVDEKIQEISTAQISTIIALAKLAESRDQETGEHIERVGVVCFRIAEALSIDYFKSELDKKEFCDTIHYASVLHDIGKVAISDAILNKPGPLTDEEFDIMRTHSQIGSGTLANLHTQYPNNFFVKLGIQITQSHHERWDGNGYPEGLKERAIPLSARIMAIADVYDALVSKRPYKPAFSHQRAIEIIKEESGSHFDPELVKVFLDIFEGERL
jgi:HD-GYP domain-containing protein (c-di-GMP phosphodiesterase class II)